MKAPKLCKWCGRDVPYAGNGMPRHYCERGDCHPERTCKTCGKSKPLNQFPARRSLKRIEGHRTMCDTCWAAKLAARPRAQRQAERAVIADRRSRPYLTAEQRAMRVSASARAQARRTIRRVMGGVWRRWVQTQAIPEFRDAILAARAAARTRERYHANPERERQRVRVYKYSNPDKVAAHNTARWRKMAAQSDGSMTPRAVARMYRGATVCPYCGAAMATADKTLDHVVPVSRGGAHSTTNVLICCRPCNTSKGARLLAEWACMDRAPEQLRSRAKLAGWGVSEVHTTQRYCEKNRASGESQTVVSRYIPCTFDTLPFPVTLSCHPDGPGELTPA